MFVLGSAHLDPEKQLLTIGARSVTLQRKPYQVLLWLVENRHRMVYREELLDRFWDGKEVYDQSLSKAVGSIRKALRDPQGSGFIETRWGLGYRYVGPFQELPSNSALAAPPLSHPEVTPESERAPSAVPSIEVLAAEASRTLPLVVEAPAPWSPPPARIAARTWLISFPVVLVALLAFASYTHRVHGGAQSPVSAPATIHSLAVLPFRAEGNKEEDQYLGLGLADAVAAKLGTVPQLRVRSSRTVGGSKLEVQALVSGEIHRVDNKIAITVRLLDGATGADLWSGNFNTDNDNIFNTEDSIAQQVSSALIPQIGMRSY